MDINHLVEFAGRFALPSGGLAVSFGDCASLPRRSSTLCRLGRQVRVDWLHASTLATDPWTRNGVCGCLLRSFDVSEPRRGLPLLCPLLFRECPEWIVPCGRHGALCCLLPRPHHCSCFVSPTVLVHQSGCLSRGPVDQYTGCGGILDRRGDSHCGRSHERVRCKAPITPPHDLVLRNLRGQTLGGVRRTQSLQGNTPRSGLGGLVNIAMNSSKFLSGSRK